MSNPSPAPPRMGGIIHVLIFFVVLALVYWVITLLPLPHPFHMIALVILLLVALVWLVRYFGLY